MVFYQLDDTVTGKVRFGDDSTVDIMGKGSIRFIAKSGEKNVLKGVYYIPALHSNIVSLGQATEVGCEVRMKDNMLSNPLSRNGTSRTGACRPLWTYYAVNASSQKTYIRSDR